MGKPSGIGFGFTDGVPTMRVMRYTPAEDAIWDAVRQAIDANMTARDFRHEAAAAWQHYLKEDAKRAMDELQREK